MSAVIHHPVDQAVFKAQSSFMDLHRKHQAVIAEFAREDTKTTIELMAVEILSLRKVLSQELLRNA